MQGGGNSGGGGGGGAERSRNGLARFRSAPVTWLEALLEDEEQEQEEDDEEEDDPLKHNQCFTQLLTGNAPKPTNAAAATPGRSAAPFLGASDDPALFGLGPSPGFLGRQNSSPANFLGGGYFGARGGDFERASSNSVEVSPSGKRAREATPVRITPAKYGSHMKREQGSDEGFLDMEMEKLFEDSGSVPCRFRAKRGCATHPRSIAERVRRTRISDRIRKLQELMPNMDK